MRLYDLGRLVVLMLVRVLKLLEREVYGFIEFRRQGFIARVGYGELIDSFTLIFIFLCSFSGSHVC